MALTLPSSVCSIFLILGATRAYGIPGFSFRNICRLLLPKLILLFVLKSGFFCSTYVMGTTKLNLRELLPGGFLITPVTFKSFSLSKRIILFIGSSFPKRDFAKACVITMEEASLKAEDAFPCVNGY